MTMTKDFWMALVKRICLAAIHTALFTPVLELFMQLNDLTASRALLLYLPTVQLIFIFLPKWYLWLPTQLIASVYVIYAHFPLQMAFGTGWLQRFWNELQEPLRLLFSDEANVLPNILSLLLFIAIILLASGFLLFSFNPYIAFSSALGYLLILQVFTTVDLFQTTVSTLLFGLLLIGAAKIPVVGSARNALFSLLLLSTAGFLLVRVSIWGVRHLANQQAWAIAQVAGYHEALENNGFFEWIEEHSPGGASVRSGFGENDSNLGGPLTQRFNTVFQAHTSDPQYWFIEAKDIYTGKGWETSEERIVDIDLSIYEAFDAQASGVETVEIPIILSDSFDYVPYTLQTIGFDFHEQTENIHFQLELPTEQYLLAGENDSVQNYTLITVPKEFDPEAAQSSDFTEQPGNEAYSMYTQLPDNLPQRVIDLAHTITEGSTTQYEQVRAIESYLKEEGGFQYSVSQTPFVPADRDYVDHFLFDSQIGYCDNFSSAMVVLCRALGIPTRWAKGFNSGEEMMNGSETYYEVTNANAHSWPVVYFDEAGWIPFEPTPSFNQPITDETASEEEIDDTLTPDEESQEVESSAVESSEEITSADSEPSEPEPTAETENKSWFTRYTGWLISTVLIVGLAILAFWKHWSIFIWLVKLLLRSNKFSLEKQTALINQLFKWKQKPQAKQTIRQYYEQWILVVPEKDTIIQAYIQLLEEMYYAPRSLTDTVRHKETIYNMVAVFEEIQYKPKKSGSH